MRYALMTEPQQGLSYDEILALARTAEEAGLEAFFRSDHYASFPGGAGMPTTDAWATLAGLARETTHDPARRAGVAGHVPPARQPRQGDPDRRRDERRSRRGGVRRRLERGRACAARHRLPAAGRALRRCSRSRWPIIHGLWTEPDGWSFDGEHWQVRGRSATARSPAAAAAHPHILFGGKGGPRLAAPRCPLRRRVQPQLGLARRRRRRRTPGFGPHAGPIGRDPDEVVYSAMTGVLVAETEDDLRARVADLLGALGQSGEEADAWLAERRRRWIMGTPDEAHERDPRARGERHAAGHAPGLPAARPGARAAHRPHLRQLTAQAVPRPAVATVQRSALHSRLPGRCGLERDDHRRARSAGATAPIRAPTSRGSRYA